MAPLEVDYSIPSLLSTWIGHSAVFRLIQKNRQVKSSLLPGKKEPPTSWSNTWCIRPQDHGALPNLWIYLSLFISTNAKNYLTKLFVRKILCKKLHLTIIWTHPFKPGLDYSTFIVKKKLLFIQTEYSTWKMMPFYSLLCPR